MATNKISVVYITDDNYAMPTCISAYSLISNQKQNTLSDIYFVVNNISAESKKRFMALSTDNAQIHIIEVQDESYAEMAKSCLAYKTIHVSYTAMFKFNLPQLLKNVDKVLYIDGDTLVQSDILELYNTSLDGHYIAAADDIIQKRRRVSPINTVGNYFNSGVMLLNLQKMREDGMTEKLIDYRLHGTNFFMDQDALNAVLGVKRIELPTIYNFATTLIDNYDVDEITEIIDLPKVSSIEEVIDRVSILHLTDRTKPWVYYMPWFTERFMKYYEKSPYASERLELLNPLKEQKLEMIMLRNRIDELNNRLQSKDVMYLQSYEQRIQGKRVILYGAGKKGQSIKTKLDGICDIVAWVDKGFEDIIISENEELKVVQNPDIIKEMEFDYILITIVDQRVLMEAKRYLLRELHVSQEKIVTLYERYAEDKLALEVAELYTKWRGHEHELAAQYIGQFRSAVCAPEVKHIGMMYKWMTIGGLQRVFSLLSFLFAEMGYQVTLILDSKDEIAYEVPDGVEVVTIPSESSVQSTQSYLQRAKRLREIIQDKKIDTIIHHGASSQILLYDLLLCKKSNIYFVSVKHETFSQYMVYRSNTMHLQQNVFKLADRLVTLSQDECNFWEVQGVKAVHINNPTGDYAVAEFERERGKHILWLGRLDRLQKQSLDIVPIMREVVKTVPDAVIKIYGNEIAPGVINELNAEIEKYHLEQNIEYCGFVTGNVGEIYQNAAVFLVTSAFESFPLTIYESKLNGTPLVTYQMPYLKMLKDGLGYIAVENDNTVQAADAIIKILQDNELRERLSKEAKESVLPFSNEKVKESWQQLFDTLHEEYVKEEKQYSAEEMKVLLETMMYHYRKGLSMDIQKNAVQNQNQGMAAVLDYYCQWTKLQPVIYPFGAVGKRVQQTLREQLHIREAFVVDNQLSKTNPEIKSVEDLKNIDCSKYLFFICCKLAKQHDEIIQSLRGIVPENNIVDLCPR